MCRDVSRPDHSHQDSPTPARERHQRQSEGNAGARRQSPNPGRDASQPSTGLADEPVAHARQRFYVAWRVAHVVQRHAQFAHRDVEPVVEIHDAGRPQRLYQLIARDHRAGVIEELDEDAQRLLRQACGMVAPRDFSRDAVDRPAVEFHEP